MSQSLANARVSFDEPYREIDFEPERWAVEPGIRQLQQKCGEGASEEVTKWIEHRARLSAT
jgi:hypothetical protein